MNAREKQMVRRCEILRDALLRAQDLEIAQRNRWNDATVELYLYRLKHTVKKLCVKR